jgi:hypothetical protein
MTGKVCENSSLESCASLHYFGFILRAYVTQEVVIPENGERDLLEKCLLVSIANVARGGGKIGPPGISCVTIIVFRRFRFRHNNPTADLLDGWCIQSLKSVLCSQRQFL